MGLIVSDAQSILDRFEAKRKQAGLEFTPPEGKAALGRFAFSAGVMEVIYLGLLASYLTKSIIEVALWGASKARQESPPEPVSLTSIQGRVEAILGQDEPTTSIKEEAVAKLQDQGVNADEARKTINLLVETAKDYLVQEIGQAQKRLP
jgi:hypothetical protein